MPYRQGVMAATGDYYRGAASGDPGLFGFLGSIAKGIGSIIPGPIGAVAKFAGSILAPSQSPIGAVNPPPMVRFPGLPINIPLPQPRGFMYPRRPGTLPPTISHSVPMRIGPGGLIPARPRRRMNVTNPKALRRAIRRAAGFEKLAKRVIGFSSPRKPKGRTYFRKTRAK
ncbi:MAG: hypothetical protein ACRDV9_14995 [Acidimicrobiia bacterium]